MVVLSACLRMRGSSSADTSETVSTRHKLSLRSDCMDSRAPGCCLWLWLVSGSMLRCVALEVFNDTFVLVEKAATSELRLEAALFSRGEAMISVPSLKIRGG